LQGYSNRKKGKKETKLQKSRFSSPATRLIGETAILTGKGKKYSKPSPNIQRKKKKAKKNKKVVASCRSSGKSGKRKKKKRQQLDQIPIGKEKKEAKKQSASSFVPGKTRAKM